MKQGIRNGTTKNENNAYDTRGGILTVKWHDWENATLRHWEGQENEPGQEGGGRVNLNTAPSTKGMTRMKERQVQPAYWA
jgi:hypothetical protein